MRHHYYQRFLLRSAVLWMVILVTASASAVVCHLQRIVGFDDAYDKAKRCLPNATTSDPDNCVIYVTKQFGELYAHSNFMKYGDYPVKLAERDITDLEVVTLNILHNPDVPLSAALQDSYLESHQKLKYIVDQDIFTSAGEIPLTLNKTENVFIALKDDSVVRRAIRLEPIRGPPRWTAEVGENLYVKVTSTTRPQAFFARLDRTGFDITRTKLLSFFDSTAVRESIVKSPLSKHVVPLESLSNEAIEKAFKENAGKTMILLGHVEDGRFITRSVDGATRLIDISIETISSMAAKYKCDVIYLGCRSAADSTFGVLKEFNPIVAIEQLSKAIEAKTLGDFLVRFCSKDLGMVIDEAAFQGRAEVKGEVVEKSRFGLTTLKEVGLMFALAGFGLDDDGDKGQGGGGNGGGNSANGAGGYPSGGAPADSPRPDDGTSGGGRAWLWWVLGCIIAVGALWKIKGTQ